MFIPIADQMEPAVSGLIAPALSCVPIGDRACKLPASWDEELSVRNAEVCARVNAHVLPRSHEHTRVPHTHTGCRTHKRSHMRIQTLAPAHRAHAGYTKRRTTVL